MTTPPLGRYGAYLLVGDYETQSLRTRVKRLEDIGYGTVWIAGNALVPTGDDPFPALETFAAKLSSQR